MKNLTEGKFKTNIKEPHYDCDDCSYSGYASDFKKIWFSSKRRCPNCFSSDISISSKKGKPPSPVKSKIRL